MDTYKDVFLFSISKYLVIMLGELSNFSTPETKNLWAYSDKPPRASFCVYGLATGTSHKWNHTIFILWCLVYETCLIAFQCLSRCSRYQNFISVSGSVTSTLPHLLKLLFECSPPLLHGLTWGSFKLPCNPKVAELCPLSLLVFQGALHNVGFIFPICYLALFYLLN